MKKLTLIFLGSAALLLAGPAAAQNLVINGGFETGDFTGFTQFGNTDSTSVTDDVASQGTFSAFFGPIGSAGGISQTLNTVAGQSFLISFDLRNSGGTPNSFEVSFGGTQLFAASNNPEFPFTNFSTTAIATGATTNLSFAFRQDPRLFFLDNISATSLTSAVPEPATWAMMLIGFGAIGHSMRKRPAYKLARAT